MGFTLEEMEDIELEVLARDHEERTSITWNGEELVTVPE